MSGDKEGIELDSDFESEDEIEELPQQKLLRNQLGKGKKSKPRVEIEYEEDQPERTKALA